MCRYPEWELFRKKRNNEFQPRTNDEGPEVEYRYSSTISLTSILDGVGKEARAASTSRKRSDTHFSVGRLVTKAGLDGYGKPRPCQHSIPRRYSQ